MIAKYSSFVCCLLAISGLQADAQLLTHFLAPLAGYMQNLPTFTIPTPTTLGSDTTIVTESGHIEQSNDIDEGTKPAFVVDNEVNTPPSQNQNLLERLAGLGLFAPTPKSPEFPSTDPGPSSASTVAEGANPARPTVASPEVLDPKGDNPHLISSGRPDSTFRINSGSVPQRPIPNQQGPPLVPPQQPFQSQWQQRFQPQQPRFQPQPFQQPQQPQRPQQQQFQQRPPIPQTQWLQQPPPQFFQQGPLGKPQQQRPPVDRRPQTPFSQDGAVLQQHRPAQLIPLQQAAVDRPLPENGIAARDQGIPSRNEPVRIGQEPPKLEVPPPWVISKKEYNKQSSVVDVAPVATATEPAPATSTAPDIPNSSTPAIPTQTRETDVPESTRLPEPKINDKAAEAQRNSPQSVRRLHYTDENRLQQISPGSSRQADQSQQPPKQRFGAPPVDTAVRQ